MFEVKAYVTEILPGNFYEVDIDDLPKGQMSAIVRDTIWKY